MLKIQVDLQEKYNILVCARRTANLRRKAKEGQHCFVQQDIKCQNELEYITWQWQTKACVKKDKGMIPMTVLALSQEDQDYYHEQKIIIKSLLTHTLTGMPSNANYHKLIIALTFIVNHGMLILNFLWVLPRLLLMGSLMKLDSLAVLVRAHLSRIH